MKSNNFLMGYTNFFTELYIYTIPWQHKLAWCTDIITWHYDIIDWHDALTSLTSCSDCIHWQGVLYDTLTWCPNITHWYHIMAALAHIMPQHHIPYKVLKQTDLNRLAWWPDITDMLTAYTDMLWQHTLAWYTMHWPLTVTWGEDWRNSLSPCLCPDITPWYFCNDSIYWHHTLAQGHNRIDWHDALKSYNDIIHWYHALKAQTWCLNSIHWHHALTSYTDIFPWQHMLTWCPNRIYALT